MADRIHKPSAHVTKIPAVQGLSTSNRTPIDCTVDSSFAPIKMSLSTNPNLASRVIAVVECDNENQIEPIEEPKSPFVLVLFKSLAEMKY